jgi:hypothetical protein
VDEIETKEKLPGIQFAVKDALLGGSGTGIRYGRIELFCTVHDATLFDLAVEKLDGYRIFSSTAEEVMDALNMELNTIEEQLKAHKRLERRLRLQLEEKDTELANLRRFFAEVEDSLGIKT